MTKNKNLYLNPFFLKLFVYLFSLIFNKIKIVLLFLEKLEEMNRRPIPENEIGLAVIFANTSTYCNPNYNTSLVNLETQKSNVTESQISPKVLAPDTEVF